MKSSLKKYLFLIFLSAILAFLICLIGNEKIFLILNKKIANPVLDFIVLYILIPLFLLLGIIPFLMLFFKKYRLLGLFSLISGILNQEMGEVLKILFKFPRPFDLFSTRILLHWDVDPFSFPSSTTMFAFGLALPILIKKPKLGAFLLILAFLVGFSVIYTGFHFPNDVIVGIFLSILIVFILEKIYENFRYRFGWE